MPVQQVQRPRVGLRRFNLVRPGQTALPYGPPGLGYYNTGPGYPGRFCRTLTPDHIMVQRLVSDATGPASLPNPCTDISGCILYQATRANLGVT